MAPFGLLDCAAPSMKSMWCQSPCAPAFESENAQRRRWLSGHATTSCGSVSIHNGFRITAIWFNRSPRVQIIKLGNLMSGPSLFKRNQAASAEAVLMLTRGGLSLEKLKSICRSNFKSWKELVIPQ
jgi:hypothetical protein